ncbi:efflux RND transporter periplasmic adaptor subunit [Legionella sp. 27cVA30]|uniref:HlyD family efflux transporter periplasmic adaptor subunit n=2 Tax=Legionellaceae TaxID=444 RepID=A0A3S0V4Z7_9GAMM|nr:MULTISPECIES: efflux RND transporter periplasmic adaptor subunit [Legionella]MCP0914937.1 efflux RND transporter periplasmic adaptor subunit [Legionella sp. 27cVA30]RUQ85021.1 HlyD family efflux transporter periplasmic adaptor subunit [Legionella septentrionalis]RUR13872.1 HlyD family efflux transporter periplasmic adaptor subunit [Legionella septentrionalis]
MKMSRYFMFLSCAAMLFACSEQANKRVGEKIYEVKTEAIHKTLYFTGIMQPLGESTITNPAEAIVETMHFNYGQKVKKGDIIFTLNSPELQKQYNDTLAEYLKAKDNFIIASTKFAGTEDLWNSGLLPKNTYLSEKSSLNTARIALLQVTHKLSEILEKTGDEHSHDLSSLSFAEFDRVQQELTSKHNSIRLKAARDGVLLYPPKSNDDKGGHLTVGANVKSGQVLALIGDLSGIRVEINVPEVDIDKIKPGMPATIHSVAFPEDELKGVLVSVNAQASASNTGALPTFTAVIEVKKLTPEQQSWVKVGMSAAIELTVSSHDKLLIPIAAVKQQNGQNVVQVRDKKGNSTLRVIKTGAAEVDKVIVDAGLQAGEMIVYG